MLPKLETIQAGNRSTIPPYQTNCSLGLIKVSYLNLSLQIFGEIKLKSVF